MFTKQMLLSFNELDFEVYNFILKNSDKIPYMTIRELAEESHVSTTTVLRFCKKLNCEGFSEFKIRFKIFQESSKKIPLKNDSSILYDFLNRASSEEFEKKLDEISVVLERAKSLIFIGSGNSGVMAQYAARYFSSAGKFALHVENPMFQISLENPTDSAVIVFSVSGEGDSLIRNIGTLRSNKTTVISVTNSQNCPIAKISDFNLSYYVQHELNKDGRYPAKVDITTQFPVVYIIETLARKVYNLKQAKPNPD